MIVLCLAGGAIAQSQCLNLSGIYQIEEQTGSIQLTIVQTGCTEIRIDRRTTSRGRTATEQHTLKIDGQFHPDAGWSGSEKLQTSATFTSGALEITARPATATNAADFVWKRLFVMRSNGDLDIREFSKKDAAYIPTATAVRQQ